MSAPAAHAPAGAATRTRRVSAPHRVLAVAVLELDAEGRYGHAVGDYAIQLGRRAGSRAVVLCHHRPDRTDAALDQLAERLADTPEASVAVQGSVLEL
jgi:hypothetical protein